MLVNGDRVDRLQAALLGLDDVADGVAVFEQFAG